MRKSIYLLIPLLVVFAAGCDMGVDSPYLQVIQERIQQDVEADAVTYSVLYDGNGHTSGVVPVDDTTYRSGSIAIVLGNTNGMAKAGQSFTGWNTEKDGTGTAHTSGDSITIDSSNVTLYAQWTQNPTYTITYDGNGNDGGEAPVDGNSYEAGASVLLENQETLSLTGYNFIGWNDAGGNSYTAGSFFTMPASDVILYASWSADSCTVTFVQQGGAAPEPGSMIVVFNTPYGTLASTSRTGYSFDGWFTESVAGDEVTSVTTVTETENHSLFAHWSANSYGVVLDRQGGTGGDTEVTATYDSAMPAAAPPARAGYTFGGYYTEADGNGTQYYDASMASMRNWDRAEEDFELKAKWTANTYTITFVSDDIGATGTMAQQSIPSGSTASLNPCTFTKTGWTFAGWATSSGEFWTYSDQANYTMGTSDVTLYADWTAPAVFQVGDRGYAGGWIIHAKTSYTDGWRYIEAAPEDATASTCIWGTASSAVSGADGIAAGTGEQNTVDIIAGDSAVDKAADICDGYTVDNGGTDYGDWYLPSRDTLSDMYANLHAVGIGGFWDDLYWSSSEYDSDYAWFVNFGDGQAHYNFVDPISVDKSSTLKVRAVRQF